MKSLSEDTLSHTSQQLPGKRECQRDSLSHSPHASQPEQSNPATAGIKQEGKRQETGEIKEALRNHQSPFKNPNPFVLSQNWGMTCPSFAICNGQDARCPSCAITKRATIPAHFPSVPQIPPPRPGHSSHAVTKAKSRRHEVTPSRKLNPRCRGRQAGRKEAGDRRD